jgi:pilus assembly protein CpaD
MRQRLRLLVCAALTGLAACAPVTDYTEAEASKNLILDGSPTRLAISFMPGSSRITPGDLARLRATVARGGIVPSDRVVVAVAGPPALVSSRFDAVAAALLPYGIVPTPEPASGAPGTAVIRRERYVVTLPACPDWSKPAAGASDFTNTLSSNFGCAAVTNLGLMAAQPADLVAPRQVGFTDARVAADAVSNYRLGKVQLPAAAKIGPVAPAANQPPAAGAGAGEGGAGTGGSGVQQ